METIQQSTLFYCLKIVEPYNIGPDNFQLSTAFLYAIVAQLLSGTDFRHRHIPCNSNLDLFGVL